jgi:ribonuclease P protein component
VLVKGRMIAKRKEFEEVLVRGKMYQSDFFGMLVLEKDKKELTKFGLIVSRKVDKRAVVRNRIRRVILECVRQEEDKIKNGYWVVFLVKKKMIGLGVEEIKKQMKVEMERAGLR